MVTELVEELSEQFDEELPSSDTIRFVESIACIKDLQQQLAYKEVILTLEQDPEMTVMVSDETTMFETVLMNQSNTVLENTVHSNQCSVMPSSIILTPPYKEADLIILTTTCSIPLKFTVVTVDENIVATPAKGEISSERNELIQVAFKQKNSQLKDSLLRIHAGSDVLEVHIKIINL